MLTGDHKATATAIAIKVGIINAAYPAHAVMTGQEFDAKSEAEIDALPELPRVVARCAPETKVRSPPLLPLRSTCALACSRLRCLFGLPSMLGCERR